MKALICLFAIGFAVNSKSQDCKNLYYLQAGKTVEITSYSKKGNENGKQVYTISDVIKNNNGATSTINSEMFDKNGKLIAKATNKITCDKGMVMIDMKMFITA